MNQEILYPSQLFLKVFRNCSECFLYRVENNPLSLQERDGVRSNKRNDPTSLLPYRGGNLEKVRYAKEAKRGH